MAARSRRTASYQTSDKEKVSTHHLLFLVFAKAAIGSKLTQGGSGSMIGSGKFRCTNASAVWRRKAQSCFCSRMRCVGSDGNDVDTHTSSPTFYQRLNSPRHILAPMVAQSDLAFRLMCEQLYNVDLSYTQMIHAVNFIAPHGETFRNNHLDVYPQSTVRGIFLGKGDRDALVVAPSQVNAREGLCDNDIEKSRERILSAISESKGTSLVSELSIEVKPTVVQIASHDPVVAAKAANMILEMSGSIDSLNRGETCAVAAIDLNLGCPQGIARKGRYGSFLHDEFPELTYNVLAKLKTDVPPQIGITAKIRLPPTVSDAEAGKLGNISELGSGPQTIDERMRCLVNCGIDLITVHGRTRFENKVTVGPADWTSVRQCVETARSMGDAHYPIISNGGIEFWEDVQKCFDDTNASGVMSSESLLEVPGLFCPEEAQVTARGLLDRQLRYAEMYLDYATLFPPLPGSLGIKGGSFNAIRAHLFKILHRYLEENPDLRSLLGSHKLNTIKQSRDLVHDLMSRYDSLSEEKLRSMKSWSQDSSWYRRHRQKSHSQNELLPPLSIEERKQHAKLKIQRIREERAKIFTNIV